MKKLTKRILAATAMGVAMAASTTFSVFDSAYSQSAEEMSQSNAYLVKFQDKYQRAYAEDAKWSAVRDRITMPTVSSPFSADPEALDSTPFPFNTFPGYFALKDEMKVSKELESKYRDGNIIQNAAALAYARDFCDAASKNTPDEAQKDMNVAAALSPSETTLSNLPAYSEYCGVDAFAYKDAIVQYEAQRAKKATDNASQLPTPSALN